MKLFEQLFLSLRLKSYVGSRKIIYALGLTGPLLISFLFKSHLSRFFTEKVIGPWETVGAILLIYGIWNLVVGLLLSAEDIGVEITSSSGTPRKRNEELDENAVLELLVMDEDENSSNQKNPNDSTEVPNDVERDRLANVKTAPLITLDELSDVRNSPKQASEDSKIAIEPEAEPEAIEPEAEPEAMSMFDESDFEEAEITTDNYASAYDKHFLEDQEELGEKLDNQNNTND